jgi:hypothetical protein
MAGQSTLSLKYLHIHFHLGISLASKGRGSVGKAVPEAHHCPPSVFDQHQNLRRLNNLSLWTFLTAVLCKHSTALSKDRLVGRRKMADMALCPPYF